jgi:hypothetical protein
MNQAFVQPQSIVRKIWGDPDLVLLIFAGSAAEFALNRAVDWLFFTNALPNDPIGRLFSTVRYAQRIIFAGETQALETLASISSIHASVERARGRRIPDWAYRDVLYMLIDYSQRAPELLHRQLQTVELEEIYMHFLRIGHELRIPQVPATYEEWRKDRERHLDRDLAYSSFTRQLFDQYARQLGFWRYRTLLEIQALLVPERVRVLLRLHPKRLLVGSCVQGYALAAQLGLRTLMERVLMPRRYWDDMQKLTPSPRS